LRKQERSRHTRRSINSEIIACIEEVLLDNKKEVEEILKKSEEMRSRLNFEIFPADLEEAKNSGRL
jgi:fatty acid-binding protein DegV